MIAAPHCGKDTGSIISRKSKSAQPKYPFILNRPEKQSFYLACQQRNIDQSYLLESHFQKHLCPGSTWHLPQNTTNVTLKVIRGKQNTGIALTHPSIHLILFFIGNFPTEEQLKTAK